MIMEQSLNRQLRQRSQTVYLTKEGIQKLFNDSVELHEGAGWDAIKAGVGQIGAGIKQGVKNVAGAVGQKIATTGKNLTTKITADKLNTAWVKAKSPTDSEAVAKVMADAGLAPDIIAKSFSGLGLPAPAAAAAATPDAAAAPGVDPTAAAAPGATTPDAAAAAPAGKKHTGGRVAGAGLSQTANAQRQRAARAAKKGGASAPVAQAGGAPAPAGTPATNTAPTAAPAAATAAPAAATPTPTAAKPNFGGGQQTVTPTFKQPAAPAAKPAASTPNFGAAPQPYGSQKISMKPQVAAESRARIAAELSEEFNRFKQR
jgi:hypothetical protein